AWLGEELCDPLGGPIHDSHIDLVAIGGAGPISIRFAETAGLERKDDPRTLLQSGANAVLIADPTLKLGVESLAPLMREAHRNGIHVCTLIPRPASYSEAGELLQAGPLPRPIPLTRDLSSGQGLLDAMRNFGRIDAIQVGLDTIPPIGTALDRLYDGFDLLHAILGAPRSVHAAESTRPSGSKADSHRNIMAIVRYADGPVASIAATNDGGEFSRSVTAWGESGRISWRNGHVDWIDPSGKAVERDVTTTPEQSLPEQLIEALDRIANTPAPDQTEPRQVEVLACVEACLLALRTGETESVDRFRSVLDRL
ncbi:MAG: hypothetical protein MK085_12030, partial [Phycisphaerales bacterium]|nr:hypothetical protein [Phycisphaerales bacterium]